MTVSLYCLSTEKRFDEERIYLMDPRLMPIICESYFLFF